MGMTQAAQGTVRVLRFQSLRRTDDGFYIAAYVDLDKDEAFKWVIPSRCVLRIELFRIYVKQPCPGMEGFWYPLYEW